MSYMTDLYAVDSASRNALHSPVEDDANDTEEGEEEDDEEEEEEEGPGGRRPATCSQARQAALVTARVLSSEMMPPGAENMEKRAICRNVKVKGRQG